MKKKQQKQVGNSLTFGFFLIISVILVGIAVYSANTISQTSTDNRSQAKSEDGQIIRVDVSLVPGHNFISLPVTQRVTMQQLCARYPLASISEFNSGNPGAWKEYQCADLARNKKILLRERVGYMIRSNESFTMQFTGKPITSYDYSHVVAGWTSIGVPMASQYSLRAHNLCGPLSGTTLDIVEVSAWVNSGWTSHICSIPYMNNFDLTDWSGYAVSSVSNVEATQ